MASSWFPGLLQFAKLLFRTWSWKLLGAIVVDLERKMGLDRVSVSGNQEVKKQGRVVKEDSRQITCGF